MSFPVRSLIIGGVLLAGVIAAPAGIVFKPGEKTKYVAPGEEEISGNAKELFDVAQKAESDKKFARAIKAYRTIVRRYPKDALAPGAGFRSAELEEQTKDYLGAAEAYRWIMERYPKDTHFEQAMEGQFRIGEMYLNGKKIKVLGISIANALDRAVEIFAAIIRNAPYGKYTARAQFDIGLAREKEGANDAAILAYQAVVDKFPDEPVAVDAQYQIGYIWFVAARKGTKDYAATEKARTAFEDFLFRFPHSEKAAQAHANLNQLQRKQVSTSFTIARFYDKQKAYRAAAIYYNEVIRQQPGSPESEKAKRRIDELRAKLGDAALQPMKPETPGDKKKPGENEATAKAGGSGMRGSANDVAPLPPPESDAALPPPPAGTSLMPASASAPGSASSPSSDSSSGSSTTSESSPSSSEASPSPAP